MSSRLILISAAVLFSAALAALFAFGILGVGRAGIFNFDGQVMFAAGRAWLLGLNPYDHAALAAAVPEMDLSQLQFFYPPQASAFCVFLGLFPYAVAREVWLTFNLAAIVAVVLLTTAVLRSEAPARRVVGTIALTAVMVGNPFTTHVVWMGQTSLIAFAATFAAWWFAGRGKWVAAGVCLGLASYKPQVCMLVVLWFLLDRNWRVLLVSGVAAGALGVFAFVTQAPPFGALLAWRAGLSSGYGMQFNVPTFAHKVGLESLLSDLGLSISSSLLLGVGLCLTVVVWLYRRRLDYIDILSLLMVLTFTFSSYLHDYDYVALAPIYISLWRLLPAWRPAALGGLGLVLVLFAPQRLLRLAAIPALEQWRTLIIIAIALLIVHLRLTSRPPTTTVA